MLGGDLNAMGGHSSPGVNYYIVSYYCSRAGVGLTRDSDPVSNPYYERLWSARPSFDFASHGFAEVTCLK